MPDSMYFDKICRDFEYEKKISITKSARRLLFSTLEAIEVDPHPTWNIQFTSPEKVAHHFGQNMFRYLEEISLHTFLSSRVAVRKSLKEITFFDVLHWLAFRLDSLCPFIKD